MNPLQMNLNAQVKSNRFVQSKAKHFMKREESNTFDDVLSKNREDKRDTEFRKGRDKKSIEKINKKEKSNVQNQSLEKKKPEKNQTIDNEKVEKTEELGKIENVEKENSNEEVTQDIMNLIASLNKLLEEIDTKTLSEGNKNELATNFEEIKLQCNEILSNIEKDNNTDIQENVQLKENVVENMHQLEMFMDQFETKVEIEDFNKLLSQIKTLLEDNEYDKTKDGSVTNDVIDKKDLTNLQNKEDFKINKDIDTDTAKNEVAVNTKNETKSDTQNQRQMSQDENKESKSGFFANKEQKNVISDKLIQDIPTNYNIQNNITSAENVKIENAILQKPNFNNILEQMVEKAQFIVDEKGSEMSLQLKPAHLGNLSMKIAVEKGIVIANIVAENQVVKEVIESNFNALRDALNEKGFGISELNVSVGQDSEYKEQQNFMNFNKKNSNKNSIGSMDYDTAILDEEVNVVNSMNKTQIDYLG